jgi:DNA-binding XRE family transcriptional regulator
MTAHAHPTGSIQAARRKLGLTQEEFARALGIGLSRLQSWEHGRATLTMTHAEMQRFRRLSPKVFNAWVRGDVAGLRASSGTPPLREVARRSGGEEGPLIARRRGPSWA